MKTKSIIKKSNNKNWWFYAFILGALCYFLTLSYSEVAFGRYLFLTGDNIDIYAPTLLQIVNAIKNGGNPFFSWSNFFGMNTSAVVASYGSPLSISNLLTTIFFYVDPSIMIFISMVINVGLCSMTFQIFAVRFLNKNKLMCLICSVCYAMCSFQMYIATVNIIWMSSLWILPLILYYIKMYLKNGNFLPLIAVYAYLFITSYYMGYIVGIFSFLYLIINLIQSKYNFSKLIKCVVLYIFSVIIGAGLSAWLLLPAAYFIFSHPITDGNAKTTIDISILDVLNQFFIGENNSQLGFYPYIYCGLLTVMMVPLYFTNNNFSKKSRILNSILLCLLIFSCLILPLYLFFHAFNAPDSWGHRFSFLISFIICALACRQLIYVKKIKLKYMVFWSCISIVFYIVMMFFQKRYDETYQSNDITYLIINILFMVVMISCILLYQKFYNNEKYNKAVALILVLMISAELIVNGHASYYHNEQTVPQTLSINYKQWIEETNLSLSEIYANETNDFFRIDSAGDYNINTDSWFDYAGTSDFGSIENPALRKTLKNLGIYTSPKLLMPYGYTDFSSMLLAIKYKINHYTYNSVSYYTNEKGNVVVQNDYYIGLGFLVNPETKDFSFSSYDAFENINALAACMANLENVNLYEKISQENITFIEDGVNITKKESSTILQADSSYEDKMLYITAPLDERKAYIRFAYDDFSGYLQAAPIILGGAENKTENYGRLTTSYIKPMTDDEETYSVSILMPDYGSKEVSMPNIYAAYYNLDQFLQIYNKLSENRLNISEYHDGFVKGSINVTEDNSLLFTSIPYDEGWTIKVNGKTVPITPLLDETFIGVSLNHGTNDIEFTYSAPYASTGLYISISSLVIYIFLLLSFYRLFTKKKSITRD